MSHRTHTVYWRGSLAVLAVSVLTAPLLTLAWSRSMIAGDNPSEHKELAQVLTGVLTTQSRAWNHADIDGFMAHYWKSEQLTFSSGGTTTRGWQATLARYKKRYSTPEKMGRLTFDHLEFTPLGDASALVLGQWHLKRNDEQLGGNFSLVFRRVDGRWVIIHDHTSSFEK